MKYFSLFLILLLPAHASAEAKVIDKIKYVYVLDVERSFDFAGGPAHECGSNLYRTFGSKDDIVNRKFSLLLAAFTAGKRVEINTEGCTGNRMKFGWVRIIH